ncbi:T9SS type A sorting domain-containing protein [Winogradskyella echinorum]|uniref:T9SS type A sorting domain-containing protein n=1 Tax=Winogradskyella echinorum TaxID=538189 RepID=A0ABR6Y5K1_9FLAO|nr:T9SS type A sorting domain-containing protein [Winogradskyella echinorum]MBC3848022.1 T9SS type A sorting domain-containing protein [Winogradskyella echinorum]MBC5752370.1 T9SS type A sorting domain-containing protein [Winogradskyella echinorum]
MKKKLLLTILMFCCISFGFSQADCATALALTPGTPQAGDTTGQAGSFSDSNTLPEVNPCSTNYNDLEYWFQYTATADGETLDITVSDLTSNWYGVFVIDNCPDSTPTCVAQDTNGTSMADLTLTTPELTAGTVYYIILTDFIEGPTTFTMNSVVNAPPSCFDPSDLAATNIMTDSADFSWTENGTATLWNIELVDVTAGGTATGTATATGVANPYMASGLMANNDYEFYVQADCGMTDGVSQWVGPFSFTTLCDAITPDYAADMSINVPDSCWDEAGSGDTTSGPADLGASDWRQGTSYAYGPSNAINLYFNNDQEWLLSPTFDLSTGGPYQLDLNVAVTNWNNGTVDDTMGSDDEVQLLMSTDGGTSWTNLATWNAANEPPVEGLAYVEDLTAITGSVQFAIYATDGAVDDTEDYDFHVGRFEVRAIPSCAEPTAEMISNITDVSADFSWTENGTATAWDIELVDITAAGSATGTPTTVGTTDNPFALTGLTANNDYEVYVRANCGGSESIWVGPVAFSTNCATLTAPFTEDFENGGAIPDCWSSSSSTSREWAFDTSPTFGNTYVDNTTGSGYFAYVDASTGVTTTDATLTSPSIDVSGLAAPALNFYVYHYVSSGTASNTITVEVWDGAAWNSVYTDSNGDLDVWENIIIDLSALTITGDVQARFIVDTATNSNFYNDIAIDDVSFVEGPSCFDPSGLSATNIMTDSADLSWTENGSATLWNIEIVDITAGGTVTGTATATGVANPYMASGLMSNNDYEFYVQADCGGDLSAWVGPFTFTTLCDAITPDYAADMSVNVPDSCWDEAGSGDTTSGPADLGASDWRQGTSYAYGPSNAINLYFNNDQEWLLSPTFDLSTGGPYQLDLNVAVTNWNNGTVDDTMGSDDEVQLLMSTDGGTSWTNLATWNAANEPPVEGLAYVEDLTAITGSVQFAIYATDGAVDDSEDYDFHVGRFEVRAIPSCPDPASVMNTVLSDTTSEFTWAAGGTETTWEYANLPSPSTEPASGTSTMITAASFTGLTPETDYDFYVRSDCGGTFGSWILISYTTPATPPMNDDCINASVLTPGGVYTDNSVDGTVYGATMDAETASCGSNGPGVWYSIVVPASGDITIQTGDDSLGGTGFDSVIEAFSGTCGALVSLGCDDDGVPGFDDNYSQLELTGLTGGETIYVRVWEYGGNEVEPFSISAFSASLGIDDLDSPSAFTYYPNPVKNTLNLNAQNTIEQVAMYNMLGQEVLRATPNAIDSELDMSSLQTGTYFVKVTIANVTKTIRVIKQ